MSFTLIHVIWSYEKIKGYNMGITEARQEAWRLMLLNSQREYPPTIRKGYTIKQVAGITVAAFRASIWWKDAAHIVGTRPYGSKANEGSARCS